MPKFKNMKDLEDAINSIIFKAMELTMYEVHNIVFDKVLQYYSEPVFFNSPPTEPKKYIRGSSQMSLMESCKYSGVISSSNGYYFTVGFNDEYLTFRYDGWGDNTKSKYDAITGEEVLKAFNNKTHGYTIKGEHKYWDEAIEEIHSQYGSVEELFITKLRECGLQVK